MTFIARAKGPLGLKSHDSAPRKARRKPLISDAVRQSARGEECTLRLPCCNRDPSTTVLAHLRAFGLAGIAQKPPDFAVIYACNACHDAIDRRDGATAGLWGFEDLLRGLLKTQARLADKGLLHIGKIE